MIAHDIPDEPFMKVAMDIMTYRGQDYLIIVDYYLKYPEIGKLENKTTSAVIHHIKCVCTSRYPRGNSC